MGSSYSTEIKPELDVEAPELEADVVMNYNKEYEETESEKLDSIFLYWWY